MDDFDLLDPTGFAFYGAMMGDDDDDRSQRRPQQSSRGDGSERIPCPKCGATLFAVAMSNVLLICPHCGGQFRVG